MEEAKISTNARVFQDLIVVEVAQPKVSKIKTRKAILSWECFQIDSEQVKTSTACDKSKKIKRQIITCQLI